MINRTYFINCRKTCEDKFPAYSYWTCLITIASWFPNHRKVYHDLIKDAKNDMANKPGDKIQVISFTRL